MGCINMPSMLFKRFHFPLSLLNLKHFSLSSMSGLSSGLLQPNVGWILIKRLKVFTRNIKLQETFAFYRGKTEKKSNLSGLF